MAESTSDSTTEAVRATPSPSASDTVNNGVETDTVSLPFAIYVSFLYNID